MGYTHYWELYKNELQNGTREQMVESIRKVLDNHKDILCLEYDMPYDLPECNSEVIHLNGIEDDGHETFGVKFDKLGFDFCKTARKPYDLPVCEILLIMKYHYQDNMRLSSDGFWSDDGETLDGMWNEAIKRVKRLGYVCEYDIDEDQQVDNDNIRVTYWK